MATQADLDRLQRAFLDADSAGDDADANMFAAEIRRLTGQAGAQPPAQGVPAPQQPAPQQDEDTYLSRSFDGLKRGVQALPDTLSSARKFVEGLSGQAVQGATFNAADEAVGMGISALTGEPYENVRRDIEGIGQDLPEGAKIGAQMFGGGVTGMAATKAVPWLGTYLGNTLAGTVGATADAVGRAAPGEKVNELMDPFNPIMGMAFGLGMQPAAELGAKGYHRIADLWNQMRGGVANPYLGAAGKGAQEALASSVDLGKKANPGAPDLNTSMPILAQDLGEGAANVAKEVGGDALATQVGAAKGIRDEAGRVMGSAADEVDTLAGDVARVDKIRQRDIETQFGKRGAALADRSEKELTAAEQFLAQSGENAAARGQKMIEDAAKEMAAKGQNIDKAALAKAGENYQKHGIVRLTRSTTAKDIPPVVVDINKTPKLNYLIKENPDVKAILAAQEADEAFRGTPIYSPTRLQDVKAKLRLAAADGDGRAIRAHHQFGLALDEAIPGYNETRALYGESVGLKEAAELGYGFDSKKITKEMLDSLPPDERAEAVSAMGRRFTELVAPMGGEAQSPAQIMALVNRLKARVADSFGNTADADAFVGKLIQGSRQIQAGKVAADLARRLDSVKPKNLRFSLAQLFDNPADLDSFIASVKNIRGNEKVAKLAAGKAERGVDADWADRAREKIMPLFKTKAEADAFVSSVAKALSAREAGKALPPIAKALRTGKSDGAREALAPVVGDDAAERILAPVPEAQRRFALAERVGAKMTSIPPEKKSRWLDVLRNSISGSLPGVQPRAAIGGAAHVERLATAAADRKIAERIVKILTETDPAKIDAAIRLLREDFSGSKLRALGMFNAQNARDPFRTEEAR